MMSKTAGPQDSSDGEGSSSDELSSDAGLERLAEKEEEAEEEDDLLAGSSSDEDAPEDIGFSHSRMTMQQSAKNTLRQIEKDRQRGRDKRRKQDDLYKMQKKQKLAQLEEQRLPEDLLDELSKTEMPEADAVKGQDTEAAQVEPRDEEADDRLSSTGSSASSEDEKDDDGSAKDGFIPLNSSGAGIHAVCLADQQKLSGSSQHRAEEFRHGQMFRKNVPRHSVNAAQAAKVKRAARFR